MMKKRNLYLESLIQSDEGTATAEVSVEGPKTFWLESSQASTPWRIFPAKVASCGFTPECLSSLLALSRIWNTQGGH